MTAAPSPAQVADALEAEAMGADLGRLAAVCLSAAGRHEGDGRQRLLEAAAAMDWAARFLAILDGPGTREETRAGR